MIICKTLFRIFVNIMIQTAIIIPILESLIELQISYLTYYRDTCKNNFFFSLHLFRHQNNLKNIFKIKFLITVISTIIFFIAHFAINALIFCIKQMFIFTDFIRAIHYFISNVCENIFNFSNKYVTQFKKDGTFLDLSIYYTIKLYYALRTLYSVGFDLFFKGALFWVYKRIEPSLLAIAEYYYKRTIKGHFLHFKV